MKINGRGQAKVLSQEEITLLFNEGFIDNPLRDKALFAVCLFTACRINEAVTLRIEDLYTKQKHLREVILFRPENTKGKLNGRQIPVVTELRNLLKYYPVPFGQDFLFPGRFEGNLNPKSAWRILDKASERCGLDGISTHSFRRTTLTLLHRNRVPLRVIQQISGHKSLDQLAKYLEVSDEEVRGAIALTKMLTPLETVGELTNSSQVLEQVSLSVLPYP